MYTIAINTITQSQITRLIDPFPVFSIPALLDYFNFSAEGKHIRRVLETCLTLVLRGSDFKLY